MTKQITFQGTSYIKGSLDSLTGPGLANLYNAVAQDISSSAEPVKRFATPAKGRERTWAKLLEWAEIAEVETKPAPLKVVKTVDGGTAVVKNVLSDADKAQVAAEVTERKRTTPQDVAEELIKAASVKATVNNARSALRANPPASGDAAKDAEMPTLRKAVRPLDLKPKPKVYPRKAGSKQAILVDALARPEGATFAELWDVLAATGKPWRGVTIRSGLAWDVNHIAGYGIRSELLNGEEFARQGRSYEAERLGMRIQGPIADASWEPGDGYDPELKLLVYYLTYPAGMDAPLPHTVSAKKD